VLKSKPLAIRDFQSAEPPEAVPLDEVGGVSRATSRPTERVVAFYNKLEGIGIH
jgi:hypothetical protein